MQYDKSLVIDLEAVEMESHVKEAFLLADVIAENDPIDAHQALLAAVQLEEEGQSEAFDSLSHTLHITPSALKHGREAHRPSTSIRLSRGLGRAFEGYCAFLKGNPMWGRDYVAIALLATPDPSLLKLAEESETTVRRLRDEWGRFLKIRHGDGRLEYWRNARASVDGSEGREDVASERPWCMARECSFQKR